MTCTNGYIVNDLRNKIATLQLQAEDDPTAKGKLFAAQEVLSALSESGIAWLKVPYRPPWAEDC